MDDIRSMFRDPETWIYLITIGLGIVVLFTPVLTVCGGIFLLMGVVMLVIKFFSIRKKRLAEP